jgi:membrane-associated phospholipid phosphatase
MLSRLRHLIRAAAYAAVTGVALVVVALLVRERFDPLVRIDEGAIRRATDFTRAHPGFRSFLLGWQAALQPIWPYSVVALVCLALWVLKGMRGRALWGLATIGVAWPLANLAKALVQRERPFIVDPVSHAPGYSFPSGHAASSATAATVLAIVVWPVLKPGAQRAAAVVAAFAVMAMTDLDRVFLGVHYPSDALAGTILGVGVVVASYAGYTGWSPARPASPPPESLPDASPDQRLAPREARDRRP